MNPLDYIKYATAPYIYTTRVNPTLTNNTNLSTSMFTDKSVNINIPAGSFYEFIIASPGFMTSGGTSMANIITVIGKVNPTLTSSYYNRYGDTQILNLSLSTIYDDKLYTVVCAALTTTESLQYEICKYAKSNTTVPDDFDSVKSVVGAYSGTLLVGHTLYITNHSHISQSTIPNQMSAMNRKPPVMFYLSRMTNNGPNPLTLTMAIKGSAIGKLPTDIPITLNHMPMSFAIYVLEMLRNNNNERLVLTGTQGLLQDDIEGEIKQRINELVQNWHILLENVNTNPIKLINFIVYFLD